MHFENMLLLRNAIIERAIDDYKACVIRGGGRGCCIDRGTINIIEVEAFFNSWYCGVLLGNSSTTGPDILKRLRKWREQAEKAKSVSRPYRLRNKHKPSGNRNINDRPARRR